MSAEIDTRRLDIEEELFRSPAYIEHYRLVMTNSARKLPAPAAAQIPAAQVEDQRPANSGSISLESGKSVLRESSIQKAHPFSISRVFSTLSIRQVGKSGADSKLLFSNLCEACRDGSLEWARNQVEEGANVNGLDDRSFSPLHYAVMRGDLEIVKLLFDHGAQINGIDGQSSAMVFFAVRKNNIPVLSYLLENGAEANTLCCDSRDRSYRRTPLSLAVENGQLEAVELLLKHNADIHGGAKVKGLSPLCEAVDKRHPPVIRLLLERGARVNGPDSQTDWGTDLVALHIAAHRGYDDVVEMLILAGADVSMTCRRGKIAGVTALHLATGKCAEKLIEHGAKIYAKDNSGQFALSGAVQARDIESVRTNLRHKAPVNAQDITGDTALHIACKLFAKDARAGVSDYLRIYIEIAEELLRAGANTGAKRAAREVVLAQFQKLLRTQNLTAKPGPLRLIDLMTRIASAVEEQAAKMAASPDGLRGMPTFLTESRLAEIVLRPTS
jgi:ankyrin repeat protein